MRRIHPVVAGSILAMTGLTSAVFAQGTAFTYQGRLTLSGVPITGTADLQFALFDSASGGTQIGSLVELNNQTLNNGLLTASLNFAPDTFAEIGERFIEIAVRSPAGSGTFNTLFPRQVVSPAPRAMGIVGMQIHRTPALDQSQSGGTFLWHSLDSNNGPNYQSFTAGQSGRFNRFEMLTNNPPPGTTLSVTVRSGEGVGGPVLGSTSIPIANIGSALVDLRALAIYLVSGEKYSLELVADAQFVTVSNQIPGASGVYGTSTPINWWFKTYVDGIVIDATAQSAISATSASTASTANSVPWAGITGVPLNVSNAFSPWVPAIGGIGYSGTKVGIGTLSPPNMLSVAGNADVGGKLGVGTMSPTNVLGVSGNADISGRLGIGTTSPQTPLHVKGNAGVVNIEGTDHAFFQFFPFGLAGGRKAYFGVPSASSTTFTLANEISGGTLNLMASNVQVTGNFINSSDARYKRDVHEINDPIALVDQLHGVRYRWNDCLPDGTALPEGEQLGFLAQEVEKVLPELVTTDGDGKKGVSYISIVPLLTEAIKQQQTQIAAERASHQADRVAKQREIDALKAQLKTMKDEQEQSRHRLAAIEARLAKAPKDSQ